MVKIFFAEQGVGYGHAPVDVEAFVEQRDAGVRCGCVEIVALVFEHGDVAEHGETVGESARNEELAVVFGREFDGHMCVGRALIVETAHDNARGARFVVLDKTDGTNFFVKFALGK